MKALMMIAMGLLLSYAHAGDQPQPSRKPASVTYEKKTKLDFEDRDVDGEFLNPEGQSVSADKSITFDSMIDPKDNFKKELKRSMGAVQ